MVSTARRRGLKSWLVEPYKQVKLGLMFLLVNCIFAALILTVFGYYVWDMYEAMSSYFALTGKDSALTAGKLGWPLLVGSALIALFVVATLLLSVKYTHQIYGPLVSIHRFIDDMLAGKHPESLQLRESDQLKDLAEKLNRLADKITPKI